MRRPGASGICWVDGEPRSLADSGLALDDPGIVAGFGLFETLAVDAGRPLELGEHLERMARGARRLELRLPRTEWLREVVERAASELGPGRGWLKLIVTAAGRSVVLADRLSADELDGQPASAVLLPWRRSLRDPLAGLKTLSYASNLVGLAEARRRGADEGIWLNSRGHVAEGCTSNVFVVQGGRLYTPGERDGILPGIVRGLVLRAARELGVVVREGKLRLKRLAQADEAFLTSSVRGLRPLIRWEGRALGAGRPGPQSRRIARAVTQLRREALVSAPRITGAGAGGPS